MSVEIPMKDLPSFTEEVTLDSTPYILKFDYNSRDAAWFISFYSREQTPLVTGIKLILFSELISSYPDRGLPLGELWVLDPTENQLPPGREDFTNGRLTLTYFTEVEIEN